MLILSFGQVHLESSDWTQRVVLQHVQSKAREESWDNHLLQRLSPFCVRLSLWDETGERKQGHGFQLVVMLNSLAVIMWTSPLLAPEASSIHKKTFQAKILGGCQFKGFKGSSSEGHENQGKVPLRENSWSLWRRRQEVQ